MQLTIDEISKTLGLQKEAVITAMCEIGLEPDETKFLEPKEFVRLKRILFRLYQDAMYRDSEEKSSENKPEIDSEKKGREEEPKTDLKEENPEDEPEYKFETENTESERNKDDELEKLVSGHHIMIDTCSLMYRGCERFADRALPLLKRFGKKIIVPEKVLQELRKHATDERDAVKSVNAKKGLALCEKFLKAGCLSVRGNRADNFADNTFYVSLSQYRYSYNMVLITQDRNLTYDILRLNELKSSDGNPVRVFRITSNGDLMESSI